MAVNYKVAASVVDITKDLPQAGDAFIVDANAWYWHVYSRASLRVNAPAPYQTVSYPNYIDAAIGNGATIYRSAHTLVELSGVIESAEAEIYQTAMRLPKLSVKEFRHLNNDVISAFRKEVDSVWSQVKCMATHLGQSLDDPLCDEFARSMQVERLDAYDTLLLMLARGSGVSRIITDDGDFSTVAGLVVHTANAKVISSAMRSGKLLAPRLA